MVGFRAAGWTCFAAAMVSLLIGIIALRGTGVTGQNAKADGTANLADDTAVSSAIELAVVAREKVEKGSVLEV